MVTFEVSGWYPGGYSAGAAITGGGATIFVVLGAGRLTAFGAAAILGSVTLDSFRWNGRLAATAADTFFSS